jgi:hypothetical protein
MWRRRRRRLLLLPPMVIKHRQMVKLNSMRARMQVQFKNMQPLQLTRTRANGPLQVPPRCIKASLCRNSRLTCSNRVNTCTSRLSICLLSPHTCLMAKPCLSNRGRHCQCPNTSKCTINLLFTLLDLSRINSLICNLPCSNKCNTLCKLSPRSTGCRDSSSAEYLFHNAARHPLRLPLSMSTSIPSKSKCNRSQPSAVPCDHYMSDIESSHSIQEFAGVGTDIVS